jgi:hypothetical protein
MRRVRIGQVVQVATRTRGEGGRQQRGIEAERGGAREGGIPGRQRPDQQWVQEVEARRRHRWRCHGCGRHLRRGWFRHRARQGLRLAAASNRHS